MTHFSSPFINDQCPICLGNNGIETDATMLMQADRVYSDDLVTVWMNSKWIPGNEGHVIIVPNEHFENVYALPAEVGYRVFDVSQLVCQALKNAYSCDGITLRQNNEPAGDQHAMHYHLHVFPRYIGDAFNAGMAEAPRLSVPTERVEYAQRLRLAIAQVAP